MKNKLAKLLSLFLLSKDWWYLFNKAKSKGVNSCWDYACRIKLRIQGSYIGHNASFESKPCFPHGVTGCFISGGGIIGSNCVIFQQVTIGSNTLLDSKNQGAPRIGKNYYIGARAKIIGNVTIGDNCRIGANAVVTKHIPENSTVVSGKIRVIQRSEKVDNHFYCSNQNGKLIYFENGNWLEKD